MNQPITKMTTTPRAKRPRMPSVLGPLSLLEVWV
jgi:hypothetical protein